MRLLVVIQNNTGYTVMIKRHDAVSAMKAAKATKTGKVSQKSTGVSFFAVGSVAVRSNRVMITGRRDLPLVGAAKTNKTLKK